MLLFNLPRSVFIMMKEKYRSITFHTARKETTKPCFRPDASMQEITQSLRKQLRRRNEQPFFSEKDKRLINRLKKEIREKNRNNVTRTEAYLDIYRQFPELKWAFLAHMVSRNSGWYMTDLKGFWLPHLLSEQQTEDFFLFYERANALIFQDAYPQLLLYRESKRRNQPLFHLLPAFHVSRFMRPFWEEFWKDRNGERLALALIINEQSYIEKRVIQNAYFQNRVLYSPPFQAQSLLQLSQVIFPYSSTLYPPSPLPPYRLAGLTLEWFADLSERIEAGKTLYAILFNMEEVCKGARSFAETVPHTASRKDFCNRVFSDEPQPARNKNERLFVYSPRLTDVWPDIPFKEPNRKDWFTDTSVFKHFRSLKPPRRFDMSHDYIAGLEKLKVATGKYRFLSP